MLCSFRNTLLNMNQIHWDIHYFCQTPLWLENPNSTSVEQSRCWLCFCMSQEGRKEPPPTFYQKEWPYIVEIWWLSCWCLGCVYRVSGWCLQGIWHAWTHIFFFDPQNLWPKIFFDLNFWAQNTSLLGECFQNIRILGFLTFILNKN